VPGRAYGEFQVVRMKLYSIAGWNEHYENNRSRAVADLQFVILPNRHDGENYTLIMQQPEAAKIFSAFVLMVQVASRCKLRGVLIRDNFWPHTPLSLSNKTRAPAEWFEISLHFLEKETDWLDVKSFTEERQLTDSDLSGGYHLADLERRERREEKEGKEYADAASRLLALLNELTGKKFREVNASLTPIMARLREQGVTEAGVAQMLRRQVVLWKGNAQMEEYLRPSTLFRPGNFNAYYASKDQPPPNNATHQRNGNAGHDRNSGTFNAGAAHEYRGAAEKSQQKQTGQLPGL
jgi:uncharacterized phage protein (TIGR02220 family)